MGSAKSDKPNPKLSPYWTRTKENRPAGKTGAKPDCQSEAPRPAEIAILVALLDLKTAAGDKPGPAIRRALELIKRVPQHLVPQFEDLSTEEMRRYFNSKSARRGRRNKTASGISITLRISHFLKRSTRTGADTRRSKGSGTS